jgi:DNA-directed RNA polymerase specialized sigma24 family protein
MSKKKKKQKTKLPNGVTEEEFLNVLEKISKKLVHKFRFGYHEVEDMKQQAAIFAMEGLERFDNSRPLENFLWTHVRNRLFNFKRNNYQRPDKPCLTCPFYDKLYSKSDNQCLQYTNTEDCDLLKSWTERNSSKKNILLFKSIESSMEKEDANNTELSVSNNEILNFLDSSIIKPEFRENYLRLKNGEKLNKHDTNKLIAHIKQILENNNIDYDQ